MKRKTFVLLFLGSLFGLRPLTAHAVIITQNYVLLFWGSLFVGAAHTRKKLSFLTSNPKPIVSKVKRWRSKQFKARRGRVQEVRNRAATMKCDVYTLF